jgi:uncharacterized protein YggL (DUF469 family)
MKKRLSKKLREFQHTGFAVCLSLNLPATAEERHPQAIEAQNLYVIGRADDFWVFTNYNTVPIPAIKEADRLWMNG